MIESLITAVEQHAQQFLAFSKEHQAVGFAVSAWGLATATFFLRNLPLKIFNWIRRQASTTLEINNEETGTNLHTYHNFCRWLQTRPTKGLSRNLMLTGAWREKRDGAGVFTNFGYVSPGDGRHFFFHRGRPFWVEMSSLRDGVMSSTIKRRLLITTIGRDHGIIHDLVEQFVFKSPEAMVSLYQYSDNGWNLRSQIPRRDQTTVTLNEGLLESIVERIEVFRKNEAWYRRAGITYKLSLLLHGPTGTGKTSLVRVLATLLNREVYEINLATMTDKTLPDALGLSQLRGSILLVEDFDSSSAVTVREDLETAEEEQRILSTHHSQIRRTAHPNDPAVPQAIKEARPRKKLGGAQLSLSTFLREMDGVAGLEDCIIIFTTNAIANIDPAVLRPGRIDEQYLFDHLRHEAVVRYIQRFVPQYRPGAGEEFASLSGATLQSYLLRSPGDYDRFIASIPRVGEESSPHVLPFPVPNQEIVNA